MLSRQHYEAIAEIIRSNTQTGHGDWESTETCIYPSGLITSLADYFAKDNPRFDRDKFLAACGF